MDVSRCGTGCFRGKLSCKQHRHISKDSFAMCDPTLLFCGISFAVGNSVCGIRCTSHIDLL